MGISDWFRQVFSGKPSAMSFYKSGIKKAEKRDHVGAIADYTAAIEFPNADDQEKAMALFNRAVVLHAMREHDRAIEDLNVVLKMHGAHADIKSAASRKLDRIKRRTKRA